MMTEREETRRLREDLDLRREGAGEERRRETGREERSGERYPEEGDEIDRAGEEEKKRRDSQ